MTHQTEKKKIQKKYRKKNTKSVWKTATAKYKYIIIIITKSRALMYNHMYEGKKIESKLVFSFGANDYLVY